MSNPCIQAVAMSSAISPPAPSEPGFVPPPKVLTAGCQEACGCDCGSSGCGGSCGCEGAGSGGASHLIKNVNASLAEVKRSLAPNRGPGWDEVWDGSTGSFLRQYATLYTDPLAPWPIFTYNLLNETDTGEFGVNWSMTYRQKVVAVNSTTAVVHKGNSASLTYTAKDASGVYTAPAGVRNKLVQNDDSTWTETDLEGAQLQYDTSGKLVKLLDGDRTWTVAYDGGGRISKILDPAGRRATFIYLTDFAGTRIRRYIDVVGRITSFFFDNMGNARVFVDPLLGRTTFGVGIGPGLVASWKEPDGAETQYSYGAMAPYRLMTITTPDGKVTNIGYGAGFNHFVNPLGARFTTGFSAAGEPRYLLNALAQRTTLSHTSGELSSMQNPKGEQVDLTYATLSGGVKQVRAVVLPGSARYTYLFDADDRLKATVTPLGFRDTMLWDSSGNQRARIDCHGHRTTYLYTSANEVRAVIDAMGNRTTTLYDSNGRVRATLVPTGARTTYGYNSLSQLATVTSPLGCVTTTLWDSLNRQRAVIDPSGARTTFTLDSAGRVKAVKNPLGHLATTLYDANGRERALIDQLGNRTTLAYDAAGNRVTIKNPLGHVVTSVFDKTNRQVAAVDPLGHRTTSGFDIAGRQVTLKNPLGKVWTAVWNSDSRRVAGVDPLGNRTSFSFDLDGRQFAAKNALGNVWTTLYDCAGVVRASVDPLGNRTTVTHDAVHRPVAVQNPLSHLSTTLFNSTGHIRVTIDPAANRTTYARDLAGQLLAMTNPLGRVWTSIYECRGLTRASIDPMGNRTTLLHDAAGQHVAMVDPMSNRTTTIYDAAGRGVARVNALGHRVTQVFDAAGRRKALVDGRGNRYTFQYDAAGRDVVQLDPLSRRTTMGYDPASQQVLRVDARGFRTTYIWDNGGRMIGTQYPDGTRVTLAFDAVGNRTKLDDGTGRYTTVWDALNRERSVKNPAGKTITYLYDAASQRRAMAEPEGGRFTYGYDSAGRRRFLVNPQSERTTWSYDAAGQALVQRLANGTRASYAYDAAGRTLRLANLKSDGTTLSSFRDAWDAASNRISRVEADGERVTWSYDNTHQLTGERRSGTESYDITYSYDAASNRRLKLEGAVRTTYVFDAADQLVSVKDNAGTTTFTWDASGNQRTEQAPTGGITTNSWNYENRLTHIVLPAGARNTFIYNGEGLRVQKQDASGTLKAIWDGQKILEETNSSDVVQAIYTLSPDVYGDLLSQRQSATTRYFHFDPLGSADRLSDGSATVTDSYVYRAFGALVASSGGTVNPFKFVGEQGYYYSDDLAKYYLRARYYDPALGRFLSADPLGSAFVGLNAYAYGNNRPLVFVDPAGTLAWWAWGCILGAAIGIIGTLLYDIVNGNLDACRTTVQALLSGIIGCIAGVLLGNLQRAGTLILDVLRRLGLPSLWNHPRVRQVLAGGIGVGVGSIGAFAHDLAEAICDALRGPGQQMQVAAQRGARQQQGSLVRR